MANVSLVARLSAQTAAFDSAFKAAGAATKSFQKDFESTASSVQAQQDRINRRFANFSGDKMAREMAAIAAAVEKVGGVTKLTETEQRKLNATVTEALAKYKALGVEAPASLQKLEQETRGLSQTTSLAGKAAGVLSSTFGQFTAANLAATAIQAVVGKLNEFVATGLKLSGIQQSFTNLTGTVKQSGAEMLASMQVATRGLVSNFDLMQSANKAILLGLPVTSDSMGELAKSATALGRAMGLDATQSLNNLITALGRSSPLILDNLGLTVKVGEANEAMAKKLGTTADALTEGERKLAFYEAAMEKARQKTIELGQSSLTLGEIMSRTWVSIGNVVSQTVSDLNVGIGSAVSSVRNFGLFMEDLTKFGIGQAVLNANLREQIALASRQKKATEGGTEAQRNFVKELERTIQIMPVLTKEGEKQLAAAKKLGASTEDITAAFGLSATQQRLLEQQTKDTTTATKAATKEFKNNETAATKAAAAVRKIFDKAAEEEAAVNRATAGFRALASSLDTWRKALEAARKAQTLPTLEESLKGGAQGSWLDTIGIGKPGAVDLGGQAAKVVSPFREAFTAFGQELPQIIFGALQGGGSVIGAIAAGLAVEFGRQFEKDLAAVVKTGGTFKDLRFESKALALGAVGLSGGLAGFSAGQSFTSKGKGALAGAAAGALAGLPLAGPTLGLSVAVGALAGAFGGLFGASKKAKEELQKLRQAQVDLLKEFGGLEKLKKAADDVGLASGMRSPRRRAQSSNGSSRS